MLGLTSNFTILIYMAVVGSQPDFTRGFIVTVEKDVRPRERGRDYERHVLIGLGHTTGITRPGTRFPDPIVTIKFEGGRSLQGSTFYFSIYLFRIRYPSMKLAVQMKNVTLPKVVFKIHFKPF